MTRLGDTAQAAVALGVVLALTFAVGTWLQILNATSMALLYLMVVVVVATVSRLWIAVVTSVAAMLGLNYFFLPPVGTFTIADPQNWVALLAFVSVSLIASRLSAVARTKTREAVGRRDELARLFDLSRDVLLMTERQDAHGVLARLIARRFDLGVVAIAVPRGQEWEVSQAGPVAIELDRRELSNAFATAQASLDFDARDGTYAGHRTFTAASGETVRLVPLRAGTKPIGVLAAGGRPIEAGTLDTLAGVVAIAIERATLLDERKAGELARQREQLKTALLASIGHDLRTPLTAIRVAASNLEAPALAPEERQEQSAVILGEVERLTRLFENVLEMARIDAGAVAAEARWAHPSEIVAAARRQVEHTLEEHPLHVAIERDVPIRLDPRLTASALAHLLENAAQYSPAGAAIDVEARVGGQELTIEVRDRGPGIDAADLPHLFDRFYRGAAATTRPSGTGMGLWIVRGLLAVQQGRVWAENGPGEGARFTIAVPAEVRSIADAPA
jgi:two-component system sensor histidine kinase KdpD